MAQQLGALTPDDLSLVLRTYIGQLTMACNSSSWGPQRPLLASWEYLHFMKCVHTNTYL